MSGASITRRPWRGRSQPAKRLGDRRGSARPCRPLPIGQDAGAIRACYSSVSRVHAGTGNTGLASAKAVGEDHLDVVVLHLEIDGRGALVLAVDELGRTIGHDVAGEGRGGERLGDLGPVGGCGALDGVGEQQHAGIVQRHVVGEELALRLDLLPQRQRRLLARIVPMVAVHHVLRRFREFLDEAVVGRRAVEHAIDALRLDVLLLHGARQQHEFAVVARRDDEIGVLRPDLQAPRSTCRAPASDARWCRGSRSRAWAARPASAWRGRSRTARPHAPAPRSWPACRPRR